MCFHRFSMVSIGFPWIFHGFSKGTELLQPLKHLRERLVPAGYQRRVILCCGRSGISGDFAGSKGHSGLSVLSLSISAVAANSLNVY